MIRRAVLVITSFATLAVGGLLGFWYVDTKPAYEYLRGEIIPNPASMGSQVLLPWEIKVNRLCPGNVLRVLYDADTGAMIAAYDRTPSSISVGLNDTRLVKSFQLPVRFLPQPDNKPVKNVRYTADVCFECNPLQKLWPICIRTPDLNFAIAD